MSAGTRTEDAARQARAKYGPCQQPETLQPCAVYARGAPWSAHEPCPACVAVGEAVAAAEQAP